MAWTSWTGASAISGLQFDITSGNQETGSCMVAAAHQTKVLGNAHHPAG